MKSAIRQKTMLNVKVESDLKKEAKKLANSFGLSLSTVVSKHLKDFIKNRKIIFEEDCIPNKKTLQKLQKMDQEIKDGNMKNFYGPFTTNEFLNDLKS